MRPLVLLALGASLLAGCPASGADVEPPSEQFFFPTGMAVSPDEGQLFVLNSNSDLTWNSGSIAVVDLGELQVLVDGWLTAGDFPEGRDGCEVDASYRYTLVCNENVVVDGEAGVRIGNFATDLGVQTLDDGTLRLFAAVRGDPSLTWIDFAGGDLACGDEGARFPECDDDHRLTRLRNDASLFDIPDEPFAVHVDSTDGFVIMTHLTDGAVTLADAPTDGAPPILSDAIGGLFAANPQTGVRGAAGVAGRTPGASPDLIYVTSRSEARVQTMTVAWPAGDRAEGGLPVIVPADYFIMNRVLPSDDGRGIAFSGDGDRAFVVNRDPSMLQIFDTSLSLGGTPANDLIATVELCQQATNLAVADLGRGDRVFVNCFSAGQLWVIDPSIAAVEAIIDVGRGPTDVAIAPGRGQVYVTNFLEDTIAVVDVRPGEPTEHRVVLRLGHARQEGGDQ